MTSREGKPRAEKEYPQFKGKLPTIHPAANNIRGFIKVKDKDRTNKKP